MKNLKDKLINNLQMHVLTRKAMFIPLLSISVLGLVGYAAIDREAPVIHSNQIEILYGMDLNKEMFDISDNKTDFDALSIEIEEQGFDSYQLGTYHIPVTAIDQFSNSATKVVTVDVVDKTGPVISQKGKNNGYVVNVEIHSKTDIYDYIQAIDNVDGDVTPFIEVDRQLDTTVMGIQTITMKATDTSGNTSIKIMEFLVSDTEAPKIQYKNKDQVTIDYGSSFKYSDHVSITDNYDQVVSSVKVNGDVNTKSIGSYDIDIVATDSSGNASEKELKVNVKDISGPQLTLTKKSVTIKVGQSFNPKSYLKSSIDNYDGDITNQVTISGSVNTKKAGTYTLTYTSKDTTGNTSTQKLTVRVEKPVSSKEGIAKSALSKVGARYVWGAAGPNAFDCSGLTQWAYKQHGISIPRTASQQYRASKKIKKSELKTGDLVFFSGTDGRPGITHVGIYVGNGQFVSAKDEKTGVKTASLNSSYWSKHFTSGGRIG